jgi:hypothetical protein
MLGMLWAMNKLHGDWLVWDDAALDRHPWRHRNSVDAAAGEGAGRARRCVATGA